MLVRDPRGVTWTMGAEASADKIFAAMDSCFAVRADALDRVDSLLREDPEVPADWVLRGYLLFFSRLGSNMPATAEANARAKALARTATRNRAVARDRPESVARCRRAGRAVNPGRDPDRHTE